MHIELLSGVHSWRTLFEPCGFEFAGLQGSKTTADAAHVLRVVKRCLVQAAVPNVTCDLDQDEEGNPNDPVLLAKHWLCSRQLSQPPTVLFQNLPAIPLAKSPNNAGCPANGPDRRVSQAVREDSRGSA